MLSQQTINIVKSTAPILAEKGIEITQTMYKNLFANEPKIKMLFNQSHQRSGAQPKALANAVYAYAQNIDNLTVLSQAVDIMVTKHVANHVKPEHYPIIAKYLIAAITEVLNPRDEVLNAWAEAYGFLADLLIQKESELYAKQANQTGTWQGFKSFIIDQKVAETSEVTSFYLKPQDGKHLSPALAGQYITVKINHPLHGQMMRQYSLSAADEYAYRITVKKEQRNASHPGIVSNFLHQHINEQDEIAISAPTGSFLLKPQETAKPIVLISAGVGITPMLNMLNFLHQSGTTQPVYFIHATQNSQSQILAHEIDDIANKMPNLAVFYCYSLPQNEDIQHMRVHRHGYVTQDWLDEILPTKECDYYFCGPHGFMQHTYQILKNWKIKPEHINYEFFGPEEVLENT
ncbi:NO-inducible flavohemoprotein [Cysteiniphilum sp. 19S12-1]|uniref:NO-inducible flavohemoprotein n=1 Tax=Cysteiniphilum sp. 19S12-1 TaxID=3453130 RepID=UPI003F83C63D